MRRSLLLRLLTLSLTVAALAVVATAVLAAYDTGNRVRSELDNDASLLEIDSEIRKALEVYANAHDSWDGVEPLVRDLAERTGRRIALEMPSGEPVVDSARLLGRTVEALPSVPAARIDAADVHDPAIRAALDQRTSDANHELVIHSGWQLTEAETAERQALSGQAVACMRDRGIDASFRESDGSANGYKRRVVASERRPATDSKSSCIPDELLAPSAASRELNARYVELLSSCLTVQNIAYETSPDPYGLVRVHPADNAAETPQWDVCERTAHVDAKRPYVAPPALLFLGSSDRFDPLSPAGWRRSAITVVMVLLAAGVITVLVGMRLVRPIRALTAAAQRIQTGGHDVRVQVRGTDEVARLATAFNTMATSIADSRQRYRALVGDVAHELRTPLANVRCHLEAAQDGVLGLDAALIDSLLEEASLLERLVADLHDLALADAGMLRIHPEEHDAADLARQVVAAHQAEAHRSGAVLRLDTASSMPINVDPARLRQALGNLVSNALEHVPAGGTVSVAVRGLDDSVALSVRDTGPGIAAEHLPHLFDRFYRIDTSRSRTSGGSGLGLAITRHLVEAHAGRLTVTSEFGAGSTFTIVLPSSLSHGGCPRERVDGRWCPRQQTFVGRERSE
ncbi:sensor histidine kinase [Nocardia pneumoniae]|uniref:sensor histidine kinase n=1 Tax=Nocardia pneumoniae TaxID=228601 RepID=UPI0002D4E1AA|nr:ATP-binding protein [Nocardia pneumoniae]